MAATVDHLSIDHVVRVIKGFTDSDGVAHFAGEEGLIRAISLDWTTGAFRITWLRDGQSETMYFADRRDVTDGPGNGRMKEYFEVGAYVPADEPGKRLIPGFGYVPLEVAVPPVSEDVIDSASRFDDGMENVWALAARRRFAEAEVQLQAILRATDRGMGNLDTAARYLCADALKHVHDTDQTVHDWLRERGLHLWYAWGAQATSGGEGTERARHIRAAEREFQSLYRKLGR